jgi:hypothetical protein
MQAQPVYPQVVAGCAQPVAVGYGQQPVAAGYAQPMAVAVPVQQVQMAAAVPIAAVPANGGGNEPPGAPPGGNWVEEQFIGNTSLLMVLIMFLCFWPGMCCVFCCPCDNRAQPRAFAPSLALCATVSPGWSSPVARASRRRHGLHRSRRSEVCAIGRARSSKRVLRQTMRRASQLIHMGGHAGTALLWSGACALRKRKAMSCVNCEATRAERSPAMGCAVLGAEPAA